MEINFSLICVIKKDNPSLNTYQALLGCDSLFEFEGEIFEKPITQDQLISRWQRMSGKPLENLCMKILKTYKLKAKEYGQTLSCFMSKIFKGDIIPLPHLSYMVNLISIINNRKGGPYASLWIKIDLLATSLIP